MGELVNTGLKDDDMLEAIASILIVLARVFSYPDPEDFPDLVSSESLDYCCGLIARSGIGSAELDAAAEGFRSLALLDDAQNAHALRVEMTRLMYGVDARLKPYGSRFLKRHEIVERARRTSEKVEVKRVYARFGLKVVGSNEPADHLSIELDFLAYLAMRERAALQDGQTNIALSWRNEGRSFCRDHLGAFATRFVEGVLRGSDNAFLRFYAMVLRRAIDFAN